MRSKYQQVYNHIYRAPGDKQWMLNVLATLVDWQHPFFAKDFELQKWVYRKTELLVNNEDGFYDGLPVSHYHDISRRKKSLELVTTAQER